jgi:hypothetical protein
LIFALDADKRPAWRTITHIMMKRAGTATLPTTRVTTTSILRMGITRMGITAIPMRMIMGTGIRTRMTWMSATPRGSASRRC